MKAAQLNDAIKLKRVAAGYYRTVDGRFEVVRVDGHNKWYWKPVEGDAHDWFGTKAEAVVALNDWLQSGGE